MAAKSYNLSTEPENLSTEPELKDLMPYMKEIANVAESLSGWLGLSTEFVNISAVNLNAENRAQALLKQWLDGSEEPPTLEVLLKAIRDCGKGQLAKKIEEDLIGKRSPKYFHSRKFMKKYPDFPKNVKAQSIALKLKIMEAIENNKIKETYQEDAGELLYDELLVRGTPDQIKKVCRAMRDETGNPQMNRLGVDMLADPDLGLPSTEPRKEQDKELPHEDSASNSWEEQYGKVINERGSVKVHITRCVLIGPARVGKSSLKQLLVHNEPRPVCKSTDLMETPVVLASMYQQSEGSGWQLLTLDNLKQMLKKSTAEGEYDSPSDATVQESHQDSGSIQSSGTDHLSELSSSVPKKDDCLSDLKSELFRFVEGLKSVGDTRLIMNGLQLIHLFDCGGQLAFQDAIPCLIHAPCAFIAVFDASVDLEEPKEWTYCPHKGSDELGRGHKESQWNILLRIFSSIHSLQCKCREDLKKLTGDELSSPWPIAVVGTHKDELEKHSPIEKSIKSHFADMKKSKPYSFLQPEPPALVENITVPMDDACTKTINLLRQQISKKASFSLDLPLTWLFLELFTRTQHPKLLFISYEDLRTLCNDELSTNGNEFNLLLRVLRALGFYAFYPLKDLGVPDHENWVCTDAATLYKEVSKLLMVQYTVDKPETEATKYLKDEGKIVLNNDNLQELFDELKIGKINDENDRVFSPRWLILVLVYIGLAAKFKRGGIEQVFIPLVLPFKGYDLPPVTERSVATLFLTLEFPSGPSTGSVTAIPTDLPCGIFPRLVVLLLSEKSKCPFEVFAEYSDRACVILRRPERDYYLYLKNSINWVEVALQVNKTAVKEHHEPAEKVYEICKFIRDTLTSSLEDAFLKLFGKHHSEKPVTTRCGFKCTCPASEEDHLAVMGEQGFTCVFQNWHYPLNDCSLSQRIWFDRVPAKFSPRRGKYCEIWVMDDPSSSGEMNEPGPSDSKHSQPSDDQQTSSKITYSTPEAKTQSISTSYQPELTTAPIPQAVPPSASQSHDQHVTGNNQQHMASKSVSAPLVPGSHPYSPGQSYTTHPNDPILNSRPIESDVLLYLSPRLSAKWYSFSTHLRFQPNQRETIAKGNHYQSDDCFLAVITQWLEEKRETGDLPRTWGTLLQVVCDLRYPGFSGEVHRALTTASTGVPPSQPTPPPQPRPHQQQEEQEEENEGEVEERRPGVAAATEQDKQEKVRFAIITANQNERESAKYFLGASMIDCKISPYLQKELPKILKDGVAFQTDGISVEFVKLKPLLESRTVDGTIFTYMYFYVKVCGVLGVLTECYRMGSHLPGTSRDTVNVLLETDQKERHWDLQAVFLVGCCGCARAPEENLVGLGTVLIANPIIPYSVKVTDNGWEMAIKNKYKIDQGWVSLLNEQNGEEKVLKVQNLKSPSILSGDTLMTNELMAEALRKTSGDNSVLGFEMEGAGAHEAISNWKSNLPNPERPALLVVKGVSDFANSDKNEPACTAFFETTTEKVNKDSRQQICTVMSLMVVFRAIKAKWG